MADAVSGLTSSIVIPISRLTLRASPLKVIHFPLRMIPRFPLFFSLCFLFVILAFVGFAQGPAALNDTDLGKSQNTSRDYANSLVPGTPNVSKGEKKSEIDPKTLQSKKMKDPAFEGGLNDLGLDWGGDKMGKPRGSQGANSTAGGRELSGNRFREAGDSVSGEPSVSNSDANSKTSPQKEHSTTDETSAGAKQKSDLKEEKKGGSDSAHEKSATAAVEKSSEKEKSSATKSDGDR